MPKASKPHAGKDKSKRHDPIAKQKTSPAKDPKASHLYTDDNPSTTLHGTGFKDEATAKKTLELVSRRSVTYQFQTINTMFYRAKNHPHSKGNHDMEAAMRVFRRWLDETYPQAKKERQLFKPVLPKETVKKFLQQIKDDPQVDSRFAEMYVDLPKGKRLANVLVDDEHPEEPDWERERESALANIVKDPAQKRPKEELWAEKEEPSTWLLQCISFAWTPPDVSWRKL